MRIGMRLLIVGINYSPELTGIGPYTSALANHLAAQGDQVTVVTGQPHYPDWRPPPGRSRRLVAREMLNGVRVLRVPHYVPRHQSAVRRALYEATFGITGLIAMLSGQQPDAILGIVPSLSGGVLARVGARRFGVPYGLLFQDLVGPALRQTGIEGGGRLAGFAETLERWTTARAAAIGVVTEAFIPYLADVGVEPARIHHVPNWARLAPPDLTPPATRNRFGWLDERQVVVHAGNMGLKQGLGQVVDAARLAASRGDPIRFVLVGGGSQAASLHAAAASLPNFEVLPVQQDGIYASLLSAADVLLLSELSTQLNMSLPSKLTSYLAAGRPILAAVPTGGATALEVQRSGAGIVEPAGHPDRLLAALGRIRGDASLAERLSVAGPIYAAEHLGRGACLDRATRFVSAITRQATHPAGTTAEMGA